MRYIKKFNSFLDFFKNKGNPFDNQDIKEMVIDSLLYLSDKGFDIKVNLDRHNDIDSYGQTYDFHYTIDIEIEKDDKSVFSISQVKPDIEVSLSYLGDYNLKLDNIYYRQSKWSDNTSLLGRLSGVKSGTKKEINLNKLSKLKDDETTTKLKIILK
jgi:hypothetical protein